MAEVAAVSGPGPADAEARALRALSMAEALPTAEPKSEETNARSSTASDASQTSTPMVSDRYTKKTPGKSYLRFESEEEELEWIENNDFIRQMSPWLYFMASTLSFVWAQSFYWWKALPDEEQVCTRDSLGNWFCEKGEVVPLILRSHPLKGNLGNKSTLVSWMLMFHTALSAIFTYLATLMPRCLRRSANAGPNPSEERIGLLYIVSRMLVMVALLCQWVHVWLMDTKYKGITNANWSLDLKASLPFLGVFAAGMVIIVAHTVRSLNRLERNDTVGAAALGQDIEIEQSRVAAIMAGADDSLGEEEAPR